MWTIFIWFRCAIFEFFFSNTIWRLKSEKISLYFFENFQMNLKDHICLKQFIVWFESLNQLIRSWIIHRNKKLHIGFLIAFSKLKKDSNFHVVVNLSATLFLGIINRLFKVLGILLWNKNRWYFNLIKNFLSSFDWENSMNIFLIIICDQYKPSTDFLSIQNLFRKIATVSMHHHYQSSIVLIPRHRL